MTKQIRVKADLHRQAKVEAAAKGLSLSDVVNQALAAWLSSSKTAA